MGSHIKGQMAEVELGTNIEFIGTHIGILEDKVVALRVATEDERFKTKNDVPHVTLAVNREGGAKPMMSNDITEWEAIHNIILYGTLQEC
jgi:hypothetical protein